MPWLLSLAVSRRSMLLRGSFGILAQVLQQSQILTVLFAVSPGSERILIGPLNFHDLARIISAACTLIATVLSLYLIWMHALHYTQPREQR